jgi:hypothetical protein
MTPAPISGEAVAERESINSHGAQIGWNNGSRVFYFEKVDVVTRHYVERVKKEIGRVLQHHGGGQW